MLSSPKVLRIALLSPFRKLFDYLPLSNSTFLVVGTRVSVPFGHQKSVMGIVVDIVEGSSEGRQLRAINDVLDEKPVFTPELLALYQWCADYYHYPLGDVCHLALPALLRKPESMPAWEVELFGLSKRGETIQVEDLPTNARLQRNALVFFQSHGVASKDVLSTAGITSSTLKALSDKGLLEKKALSEKDRLWKPGSDLLKQAPLTLNQEQQAVIDQLTFDGFISYLLDGVTGSGKTEIYLQAMERVLSAGKQVLVLVPEIGLTPQTLERFERRFNCPIAALHSGLSDKSRYHIWQRARNNQLAIVIGTRSSIFTPLLNLGLIIVDEEHDLSYKQQEGVRYSARDLAIVRAQRENIPLILGSATPALETLHNALSGRYQHLRLTSRVNSQLLPSIQCVEADGFELPPETQNKIQQALSQQQQVLIFINRRGYAPTLICQDCGWISQCQRCDSRTTLHRGRNSQRLHCHHCDARYAVPVSCPQCHSKRLQALGAGTQRSEQMLETLFPQVPVLRIDKDSISRKGDWEQILEKINSGEPCIIVGTQMLAKGHHFANLGLAVILGIDNGLFSSDFRGAERIGQLLTQVSGRVGREQHAGQVIIQTQFSQHPMLQQLLSEGYSVYAQQLLAERRLAAMPPLTHLALVRCHAQQPEFALNFLQQARRLAERIHAPSAGLQYLGPFPAALEKRNNRYHYYLQIKSTQRSQRQHLLARLCEQLESTKQPRGLHWLVDVDPQEF